MKSAIAKFLFICEPEISFIKLNPEYKETFEILELSTTVQLIDFILKIISSKTISNFH